MKTLILLLLFLFFLMPAASAQTTSGRFLGGCSGGAVLSEVSGDHASGPDKPGLFAGLFVLYPLSEQSLLSLELMYMQKGSRAFNDPAVSERGTYRDYKLSLHYAEMPVLLLWQPAGFSRLHYLSKLYVETGVSLSVLLAHQEEDMGLDIAGLVSESRPFYPAEISLIIGFQYRASPEWQFSFRLNQGVTPFRKHGTSGGEKGYWWNWHNQFGQYHTAWSLGIRYLFAMGF